MPESPLPALATRQLCLEDFKIGDVTETQEVIVSHEMIRDFAETYDPQPHHLDKVAAKGTIFGEVVGSGWQTLALTMRLLVDAKLLGGTPIVGAEFRDMRFHGPVRPGDTLRANAEILSISPSSSRPDRGFLDMKVTTRNAAGHALVTQTWRLVVPTRAGARSH